ncbi:MAG: transcription-repair coupling factor [Cyclobacteriaceae bacterium]
MKTKELIKLYKENQVVQAIAESIKANEGHAIQVKGLTGSLDAIVSAGTYAINHQNHIFILHEKEDAAFFYNDLQNLMENKEVLFFPTSYKRPYQFEETENANILMRADILNKINNKSSSGEIIVTYPEALTEKVINKRSLVANTLTAKLGDRLDVAFITEMLISYDFEKTDFVYEPGQFATRGGIIDIFSFARELPYRIELFGDEVESIRLFEPENQLSVEDIREVNIIPNVQTKLLKEERQSFLDYIPKNTKIWVKDYQHTVDIIEKYFEKASGSFDTLISGSNDTQVVFGPEALFETVESFTKGMSGYVKIEFGNRFYLDATKVFDFKTSPQPEFHKKFDLVVKSLNEFQTKGYTKIISAESPQQVDRIRTIIEETDPHLQFNDINIGLRAGFIDHDYELLCYTDHQIFERYHRYKVKKKHSKSKALTLKELKSLQPGDFVVHVDHGVGRFAGMDTKEVNGNKQEVLRLVYRDDDLLYISVHSLHKISRYSGKEGTPPAVNKLGSQEWENKKKRVKKKVKDIAKELIQLYAKRKAAPGYAFPGDNFLQAELESSFIYQDTPDQALATEDVKTDMEKPHPMDRLVCGDVGFGKTEVAIRAAFKAVSNGKQAAVLVPTTILALQHYNTFRERLSNFPLRVEYINRFRTTKDIKQVLKDVEDGQVDILIGTHRIVNKDVKFKDLGIMIIDEEQKFGVKVKEKLKELRVNVDALTLTATPIPRTLHFSLMGARDLSIISTPPPNRQPVTTELHEFKEEIIRDAISYELRRGGQVFFVHNRIGDIEQIANIIHKLVPDARIGIAHGQMDGPKLEKAMLKFVEGENDVLVSTNIIESGLDIPNANTIIINRAHMFGLSDLHQMRGRVGRSNKKAFCYLLTPPVIGLSSDARKRLSTLEEFSDLGDGFKVAMRDLDIRGAGNLLGGEQSGFINDLGFEMYHKILDEAISELKENEFKELFKDSLLTEEVMKEIQRDCSIETDLEILIPDSYVNNITERLSLYSRLDNIDTGEELEKFRQSLIDRFGPLPDEVKELIKSIDLRTAAKKIGLEKLTIKSGKMRCYFYNDDDNYFKSERFGEVLKFIKNHPKSSQLKDVKGKLILIVTGVTSIDIAVAHLSEMVLPENKTEKTPVPAQ